MQKFYTIDANTNSKKPINREGRFYKYYKALLDKKTHK